MTSQRVAGGTRKSGLCAGRSCLSGLRTRNSEYVGKAADKERKMIAAFIAGGMIRGVVTLIIIAAIYANGRD